MIKEKKKQGRPKKGKQPVQAAMESPGSSSESECEVEGRPEKGKQPVQAAMESLGSSSESECAVRSRSQRVRQLPARFRADSSSESKTDSGILCGLCSAREPPHLNVAVFFLGGLWKLW